MKFFGVLFLICWIILASTSDTVYAGQYPESCGNVHNFHFGTKSLYDKVMYVRHEVREGKTLQKQSYDLAIPAVGEQPKGVITAIEVIDQLNDGTGGCVYLTNGGPRYSNVVLHIKTQRGEGVNFIINVWGKTK